MDFFAKIHKYKGKICNKWDLLHIFPLLVEFLVGFVPRKFPYFVLEHCKLLEEVVHGLFTIFVHRSLAVERHKFLYAIFARSHSNVAEEYEVEHKGGCQY